MDLKYIVTLLAAMFSVSCGGGSSGGSSDVDNPPGSDSPTNDIATPVLNSNSQIPAQTGYKLAYLSSSVHRNEIRLLDVELGTDKRLYKIPFESRSANISGLAWRPNGKELAFSGNFEESIWKRDIYVLASDGSYLRRITNAPRPVEVPSANVGTVVLRSRNFMNEGRNMYTYVQGSAGADRWLAPAMQYRTSTFTKVMDFGPGVSQWGVVNNGQYCLYDLAGFADVEPGESRTMPHLFSISLVARVNCLHAEGPQWSADGDHLYFIRKGGDRPLFWRHFLMRAPSENVMLGGTGEIVSESASYHGLAAEIAKPKINPNGSGQFLLLPASNVPIKTPIYWVDSLNEPNSRYSIKHYCQSVGDEDTCKVHSVEWQKNGGGFYFSSTVERYFLSPRFVGRIYYKSLSGSAAEKHVLELPGKYIGDISLSHDGNYIAFEVANQASSPYSIGILNLRTGQYKTLLNSGAAPTWVP